MSATSAYEKDVLYNNLSQFSLQKFRLKIFKYFSSENSKLKMYLCAHWTEFLTSNNKLISNNNNNKLTRLCLTVNTIESESRLILQHCTKLFFLTNKKFHESRKLSVTASFVFFILSPQLRNFRSLFRSRRVFGLCVFRAGNLVVRLAHPRRDVRHMLCACAGDRPVQTGLNNTPRVIAHWCTIRGCNMLKWQSLGGGGKTKAFASLSFDKDSFLSSGLIARLLVNFLLKAS